jgi:hypothetical protein
MGFTPRDINDMSLWQFEAVCEGWAKQYGDEGLSETQADELWEWLQSKELGATAH